MGLSPFRLESGCFSGRRYSGGEFSDTQHCLALGSLRTRTLQDKSVKK